mmetsp:Transcript_2579/g.8539  ORF Transcript_2579/g.8539 Transcript_2579/m.8539 type:complete len:225 (+) Transcript_2579:1884-2558(+)
MRAQTSERSGWWHDNLGQVKYSGTSRRVAELLGASYNTKWEEEKRGRSRPCACLGKLMNALKSLLRLRVVAVGSHSVFASDPHAAFDIKLMSFFIVLVLVLVCARCSLLVSCLSPPFPALKDLDPLAIDKRGRSGAGRRRDFGLVELCVRANDVLDSNLFFLLLLHLGLYVAVCLDDVREFLPQLHPIEFLLGHRSEVQSLQNFKSCPAQFLTNDDMRSRKFHL